MKREKEGQLSGSVFGEGSGSGTSSMPAGAVSGAGVSFGTGPGAAMISAGGNEDVMVTTSTLRGNHVRGGKDLFA